MDKENKLHADLLRLLQRLREEERQGEEKRKKYEEKGCLYLEGVYSGAESGYFFAAEMLDTVLACNDVKREEAKDGKTRL